MGKKYSLFPFLFILIILVSGCKKEEDPITAPSEHFEPEGWVISDMAGTPVMVIWQGQIQSSWEGRAVSDTLVLNTTDTTVSLEVKFLDSEKKLMSAPADEDYTFGWVITDTSLFEVLQDTPGWNFRLLGKTPGSTTFELQVLHQGHADVRTPKIPVVVQ